jgi:hypothetical protein
VEHGDFASDIKKGLTAALAWSAPGTVHQVGRRDASRRSGMGVRLVPHVGPEPADGCPNTYTPCGYAHRWLPHE